MMATYVGVGVNVAVGVGQDQHVNVHLVQKGGHGTVDTVISGDLSKNTRHWFCTNCCDSQKKNEIFPILCRGNSKILHKQGRNVRLDALRRTA